MKFDSQIEKEYDNLNIDDKKFLNSQDISVRLSIAEIRKSTEMIIN